VLHKRRLLSDNELCCIAEHLAKYLEKNGMVHVRGAPSPPQAQGKIERWHQSLKNRIQLENYYLEGELEAAITAFIEHYNHHRYYESFGNVTPVDVYFGRAPAFLAEREKINAQTIQNRRLIHQRQAAQHQPTEPDPPRPKSRCLCQIIRRQIPCRISGLYVSWLTPKMS
jgi:putative transposase